MTEESESPLHRHLVAMKEIAQGLESYRPAIVEIGNQIQQAAEKYSAMQQAVFQAIGPLTGNSEHIAAMIQAASALRIPPELAAQIEATRRAIDTLVLPNLEEFRRGFETLPSRTKAALLVLGNNGWYLDFSMPIPDVWRLQEVFEGESPEEAEVWLCNYYEQELERIKADLLRRHPDRKRILEAAFSAHVRGEYELSIPVFIAQADGLCKQAAGSHYFIRKGGRPATALHVEQTAAESITCALLSPLATTLPLGEPAWDKDPQSPTLNRHHVLHGESLNYGSRENSLRAISFINYVSGALFER